MSGTKVEESFETQIKEPIKRCFIVCGKLQSKAKTKLKEYGAGLKYNYITYFITLQLCNAVDLTMHSKDLIIFDWLQWNLTGRGTKKQVKNLIRICLGGRIGFSPTFDRILSNLQNTSIVLVSKKNFTRGLHKNNAYIPHFRTKLNMSSMKSLVHKSTYLVNCHQLSTAAQKCEWESILD